MEKLYQHQSKIIVDDPTKCGLWLGTGGGKTRVALEIAQGKILIIAPKQQVLDKTWENNAKRFSIKKDLTVMSKETFRRDWRAIGYFNTVIVDEAHTMFGVTPDTRTVKGMPIPKTSQLFDSLKSYLEIYKPERFYMCTATPVSKPMNVWAIATLLGHSWDFFKFREKYYFQRKAGWRSIWLPRDTQVLKNRLAELIKSFGYTGRLSDWFDVPEQTHTVHYVGITSEQKSVIKDVVLSETDPMVRRAKLRTVENGVLYSHDVVQVTPRTEKMVKIAKHFHSEKIDYILERAIEFPKILIFANYIAQIDSIAKELEQAGHKVLKLTGQTKNRGEVISTAEINSHCIVIAQCGISSGYELKTFDCVIFASKSYKYLDLVQAQGRVLRADHLKKNLFIHLVVRGGVDELCHKTLESGRDFEEKVFTN